MAKKKKSTPSFDAARFRMGEEASMAGFPTPTPDVFAEPERAQLVAKGVIPPAFTGTPQEIPTSPEGPETVVTATTATTATQPVGPTLSTLSTGPTGTTSTGPTGKKVLKREYIGTGLNRVLRLYYDDGTEEDFPAAFFDPNASSSGNAAALAAKQAADAAAAAAKAQRQSAFDLLYQQFAAYGLQGLVEPLRGLIESGVSPSEFTIKLREADAYKKRFAANQSRIQKGLRALSEAEYIGLEDQYQDVMRRYGLPDTYYARGDMGRQEGFEKFIGGDVSPVELEDRIQTAQRRVINAAPQIKDAIKQYYGAEINNGDILAYVLNPEKAIEDIKRKVTAAEIGGAAAMSGLTAGGFGSKELEAQRLRAEELGRYGVTGEAARQGFQTIAEVLPRGSQLAEFYKQGPYTQTTAEQEVFGLAGATEASKRRRQLTQLEQSAFSGQAGIAGGALGRERAGAI